MFQGESGISIDDKGRMAIPTAYRDAVAAICGNRLMLVYNPFDAHCLWLFPPEEWGKVREQVNALHSFNPAHRELKRKLVGIEKRATLLGLGDKFELWSEEAHLKRIVTTISPEDITAEMRSLSF